MRKDTALLLLGVALLGIIITVMWWAWWSSPRITTPGCLSAKDAVIVVYTDRQGLLAEHMILQLSARWVNKLPSDTKFCIAHEDDIGIHGLPIYPYVVVRGEDVVNKLAHVIINASIGKGYFPLRADICARLAYETYSYGGENMPAPRYKREAELIVVNPIPSLIHVRRAQLLSELPELSVQSATKIISARTISDISFSLPKWSVYPVPILHSKYNLSRLTPALKHINDSYYVFKRMGWTLYDLGIVRAVGVKKQAIPDKAFLTISLRKKNITLLIVLGQLRSMCSQVNNEVLRHIIALYKQGEIGLGIIAYIEGTDNSSISLYKELAQENLTPIRAYYKIVEICKSSNIEQNNTSITMVMERIRVKPIELAQELPLLIISSGKLNYYIMMKLSDADVSSIDSMIASLSG